jgi:hypothetical protein
MTRPTWRSPVAIPRISRDIPQMAAFDGVWLHGADKSQGYRSAPELRLYLVAGDGFEPS